MQTVKITQGKNGAKTLDSNHDIVGASHPAVSAIDSLATLPRWNFRKTLTTL